VKTLGVREGDGVGVAAGGGEDWVAAGTSCANAIGAIGIAAVAQIKPRIHCLPDCTPSG